MARLSERAGQHEQDEDREHDIEHAKCRGSTRRLHRKTSASTSQVVAKLSISVPATLSRAASASSPTIACTTNAGNTISATARPSAAGSTPHCSVLTSTLSIATVKNPSGSGDPIGRSTIRVISCRSALDLGRIGCGPGSTPACGQAFLGRAFPARAFLGSPS